MVGETVYIVVQHLIREQDFELQGVYATWDGAYEALRRIRESEESFGYQVKESGYMATYCMEVLRGDEVVYEFYVYSRTIRE